MRGGGLGRLINGGRGRGEEGSLGLTFRRGGGERGKGRKWRGEGLMWGSKVEISIIKYLFNVFYDV